MTTSDVTCNNAHGDQSRPKAGESHILYRFFAGDELLYIGITNNPWTRTKAHQSDKSWFRAVTRSTMEHFDTRAELIEAEIAAIQAEKPKHNVTYNNDRTYTPPPSAMRVRTRGQAQSVFGGDANRFPQPGEEPEDLSWLRQPKVMMPLGCPDCGTPFCCYRPANELGQPVGDRVFCGWCQSEWSVQEWRVRAGISIPEGG
ncbi:MAG: GIY-YIG nuclease family protein [Mycolicibacterium neoaurum]|uniref:GIY-YIG nuclease family protein n=1 Tax=Mycolicibacterium neoaurum TaxID=1795 RepID=UPI002FF6C067